MPPLGPTSQRAVTRARAPERRRREANLRRAPTPAPPSFPRYVPPRPGAIKPRRPTPKQVESAKAIERGYRSQAGAVRRVAKTQKTLGPGKAVRPEGRVLRRADIAPRAQEQAYRSLGRAVAKQAVEKAAKGTVLYKGHKIAAARLSSDPRVLKAAGFKPPSKTELALTAVPNVGLKALKNAPADVVELATTTPTSLVHLGTTAVTHPEKLPGELAAPYIEAVKHPVKAITEHPVSTALMFAPSVKLPLRVGGRVARLAGKQTLERPAATLTGTTLKERRAGSPELFRREKARSTHISQGELHRRVDEFYDAGQQHKQAALHAAGRQANERFGDLPKGLERDEAISQHLAGAKGGAHQHVERQFAREFGSHWQVHRPMPKKGGQPSPPVIIKPKNAPEGSGVIHADKADADVVAKAVPFDAKVMELEGATPGETSGYAVVPKVAAERFGHHKRVGRSPATGSVIMRVGSRQFRKSVLPLSTKWLGGQVGEGALRAAIHGAGPTSLLRARRLIRQLERTDPQAAKALRERTLAGGQFGVTGPAAEFAGKGRTLAEEFEPTGLAGPAEALTRIGAAPGLRHVRKGFRRYSEFVFNDVNGRIEQLAKTAMLGKAVKAGPLMERNLVGLSDKAIAEAAQGLRSTSAQVELGRAIDRAYGKYSKFGPHARETILHSTPFIPWFRNMVHFLGHVLPQDHPVHTALLADLGVADEEWRKAQRLSTRAKGHVPGFMLGSYPVAGNRFVQVGRFGPFLPGEPVSAAGGQVIPQFGGMLLNAAGVDWTGKEIKGGQGRLGANVALTGAETFVPGLAQVNRITGLGERYVRGKTKKPSIVQGKRIDQAVLDLLNPVRPIGLADRGKRKRKGAGGLGGGGLGGGGLGGGGLGGR